jgi:hydrogenase maturation protein HypF
MASKNSSKKSSKNYELIITGMVQGVGFRPYIWRAMTRLGLVGEVSNQGSDVRLVVAATPAQLEQVVAVIQQHDLRLAVVERIAIAEIAEGSWERFSINSSGDLGSKTGCSPDASLCDACLEELFDPHNRRYRYPFISCMHCGPRYSILHRVPYDRCNTSMEDFALCEPCQEEYSSPESRRFHAQPIACAECGPRYRLWDANGAVLAEINPIEAAAALIKQGKIVAVAGVGGFHLVCDATSEAAVQRLRTRKQRPHKPLAVMMPNWAVLSAYVEVNPTAKSVLKSTSAPIVLLRKKQNAPSLAECVAPNQDRLGCLVPNYPIDYLLMDCVGSPVVMTSGNRSGQPLIIENSVALQDLQTIADAFLMHDRRIINRLDDSVVAVEGEQIQVIRRALGYAPTTMPLPPQFYKTPTVLALGGELKSTFCLLHQDKAIISQHLGDLESVETLDHYEATILAYRSLYQINPEYVATDLHPEYLSRKYAETLRLPVSAVQHHHAHLAACLGEHQWPLTSPAILGIALDGAGWGDDQTLWGGELFRFNYLHYERLASIDPFALVGGAAAIKQPWRALYSQLKHYHLLGEYRHLSAFEDKPLNTLDSMIEHGINTMATSSMGRIFDAVAALLGCCSDSVSYEGQAASELETMARLNGSEVIEAYPIAFETREGLLVISFKALWKRLLEDYEQGVADTQIAHKFHQSVIEAWSQLVWRLARETGIKQIALSGGVMQNQIIRLGLQSQLQQQGLTVLIPEMIPCNDAGISFGQALVVAARYQDAGG